MEPEPSLFKRDNSKLPMIHTSPITSIESITSIRLRHLPFLYLSTTDAPVHPIGIISQPHHGRLLIRRRPVDMLKVVLEVPRHAHCGLDMVRFDEDPSFLVSVPLGLSKGNRNLEGWRVSVADALLLVELMGYGSNSPFLISLPFHFNSCSSCDWI